MIIKRAVINIIRMPVRTIIISSVLFITVFIMCFCNKVTQNSNYALNDLSGTYPFVATAIVKKTPSADGSIRNTHFLCLDDAMLLSQSEAVYSYNIRMMAGSLAEDEIISALPDNSLFAAAPAKELDLTTIPVYAVNNLFLEQEFMDETYIIYDGTAFTDKDVYGGNRAIVISESIALKYHLSCGDTVNYKIANSRIYRSCIIRGIYRERNGEPVFAAYIPLSDYFSDTAIALQGMSRADQAGYIERSLDKVNRIDFLLTSYENMPQFLYDAKEHGFDFEKNEIIINDKAYHIAASGIREIRNISMFVFCLTVIAGVIIIYSLIAFYRRTREKETKILHCLGMKYWQIHAIYCCEYAVIFIFMSIAAAVSGTFVSDQVIHNLEKTYITEIEENANQKDFVSDAINSYRSTALSYPISLHFSDNDESKALYFTEWRCIKQENHRAVRYEKFFDMDSDRIILLKGTDNIVPSEEYGEEILYETNRLSGAVFTCSVPADSGYRIGNTITVCRYSANDLSMMMTDVQGNSQYLMPYMAYVVLKVGEFNSTDTVEVSFDDLTLISTYLGMSSSIYRNIRYDKITAELENTYE